MAQSIILKRSSVSGNSPTTGQMSPGELAINTSDGKLFLRDNASVRPVVTTGNSVNGSVSLTQNIEVNNRILRNNLTQGSGDVINLGSDNTTPFQLYYWDGNNWRTAASNNDMSGSMLAIALSNASSKGMFMRGLIDVGSSFTPGAPLYVRDSAGYITDSPPTTSGEISRIVGQCITGSFINFNPSNEWVELA